MAWARRSQPPAPPKLGRDPGVWVLLQQGCPPVARACTPAGVEAAQGCSTEHMGCSSQYGGCSMSTWGAAPSTWAAGLSMQVQRRRCGVWGQARRGAARSIRGCSSECYS